ncbi:hypothetical protein GCM10027443_33520 [Pontibacter brevis]
MVNRVEVTGNLLNIECCVKDTGVGFNTEKLKKVYETLNKEQSITRLYGGTGLGLTISKKLLELQGGKLWLDDKNGQGSCFYFSISYPLAKQEHAARKEASFPNPARLKGLKILVAEDNQLNELLLSSQLQLWDVSVDIAYDGEQALAKASEKEYDLILMDIQMPKLDGIEATYRIRNTQNPNRQTPIIAFTANIQKIDVERYSFYGFDDCLLKPYHESRLFQLISRHTGRSKAAQAITPQAEDTTKNEPALYDFSGLGNLKNDALFIRKMQRMFVDTVPRQLDELEEAIDRRELETAAHLAHKLKSTFGNIQIQHATEAMKQIEGYAKSNVKAEEMGRLMHTVREVTTKVIRVFSEQLEQDN